MGEPASSSLWQKIKSFLSGRENLVSITSYVVILSVMIIYIVEEQDTRDIRFIATILALTAVMVIEIVWEQAQGLFRSNETGQLFWMIVIAALTIFAIWCGELLYAIYILFMLAAQAILMWGIRKAMPYIFAVTVGYFVLAYHFGVRGSGMTSLLLSFTIGLTFVITISHMMVTTTAQNHRMEELLIQLQHTNSELEIARKKEKELAIAEERVRMARDIHDGLGHHLTVLSIQLQAADKLIHTNQQAANDAIRTSRSEVQLALQEVRNSVAAMRSTIVDQSSLVEAIQNLVEDFNVNNPLRAVFETWGELPHLSTAAAQTLFRSAQEGLTNSQKHAEGATFVKVTLAGTPDEARLTVTDDGTATEMDDGAGYGLLGIRERVEQLKGTFTSGCLPEGGFQIEIRLPLKR